MSITEDAKEFFKSSSKWEGEGGEWGLEYLDKAITYACRERGLTQEN
jgi:hypothetical protein